MSFYTVRPISDRTPFTGEHDYSDFMASWMATQELLEQELEFLGAKNVVLEADVIESQIRVDGGLYANAKAASPAVRVEFDSQVGPLVYATDRFVHRGWAIGRSGYMAQDWQHNVRAIALGLEALRKVGRYGITQHHQQYTGFKTLPAGGSSNSMSGPDAMDVLYALAPEDRRVNASHAQLLRWAKTRAHPDRNDGDRTLWDQVEQAARVLNLEAS